MHRKENRLYFKREYLKVEKKKKSCNAKLLLTNLNYLQYYHMRQQIVEKQTTEMLPSLFINVHRCAQKLKPFTLKYS